MLQTRTDQPDHRTEVRQKITAVSPEQLDHIWIVEITYVTSDEITRVSLLGL